MPFAAAAGRALYASHGPIVGDYNWRFPGEPFDPKRTLLKGLTLDGGGIFTFGAQVVEVEIDEVTGQVELVEAWCAHDVGRALNPASVEGQIHGGFVQGIGYALSEQLLWEDGRLTNPTMMDYKVPGAADVPYRINPIIIEKPALSGPFGAKAIGEHSLVPVAPAICNAIHHATGARITAIPATSERVLEQLLAIA